MLDSEAPRIAAGVVVLSLLITLPTGGCQLDNGSPEEGTKLKAVQEERTWVAIEPRQCLTNAWEADWLAQPGNDYSEYPKDPTTPGLEPEEFAIVQEYYARQGVVVSDSATAEIYEVVCAACTCPEGHTMFLLVRDEDVETMLGSGYRVQSPPVK